MPCCIDRLRFSLGIFRFVTFFFLQSDCCWVAERFFRNLGRAKHKRHTGITLESRKKHKVTPSREKIGVTRCDTVCQNHTNFKSTHVFTKSENFLFCFKGVREHCRTFTKLFHQHQLYISSWSLPKFDSKILINRCALKIASGSAVCLGAVMGLRKTGVVNGRLSGQHPTRGSVISGWTQRIPSELRT